MRPNPNYLLLALAELLLAVIGLAMGGVMGYALAIIAFIFAFVFCKKSRTNG
jgi:hypothetical protein